jgi:lysyl-tRNA synthetase class 2
MAEQTESELRRVRLDKLDRLHAMDGVRFRNDFRVTSSIGEAVAAGTPLDGPALDAAGICASLAGRVMAVNSFGKAAFLRIRDRSGVIQVYVRRDSVPPEAFERFELTDIGDIAAATGVLMRTRTGELTLKADDYRVLSKALRPLPEKWHGMKDPELRQRMRYVDLIVNEDSRRVFRARSQIIRYIRRFLDDRDFLEVETPMMHAVLGGANARPFVTHHNTLDMDLFLRIAPELFLKRLVVGGFDRVYEINRNFRNEGMDARHNPEFTMLEFYWAYATYHDLLDLTEELLRGLVQTLLGTTTVTFKGHELDFGKPFARLPVCEALRERCGATDEILRIPEQAYVWALSHGVTPEECDAVNRKYSHEGGEPRDRALELGMLVFEHEIEDSLIQPTFLTDFPAAVSPLSRRKDADPGLVDRFELYVCGWEVANAFSELNDPQDQEARFRRQVAAKSAGDAEAMEYDEDYVRALEYGLPPTAGEGIGIDRVAMLLTGQDNIRDVILFPLLRPET